MTNEEIAREIVDSEWMKSISPMNPYILEQKITEALQSKQKTIEELRAEVARINRKEKLAKSDRMNRIFEGQLSHLRKEQA